MYIVNMDLPEAKATYLNKFFRYDLSSAHKLLVKVTAVNVYGGVVRCRIVLSQVLQADKKDQTVYKDLSSEYVLAGRLSNPVTV